MSAFRNIILVGATGSIGSIVLAALEEDSSFNVTILQRASSKAQMPSHLKVIRVSDSYPEEELVAAFRGQDAVISCLATSNVSAQKTMIDAAIRAGVRRYSPSEYGLNNMRPDAQALSSTFAEKGQLQAYLREKAEAGQIEWMSISCGMWLKWAMARNFMGMHVSEKKFVFLDDGEGYISSTTEENTALGLVKALKMPEETKNRNIFLSDFAITQRQMRDALERIQGVKYVTENVDSAKLVKDKKAAFEAGDRVANYALIETGFTSGRYGAHLEKEGEIMNVKLGLPAKTVDEVLTAALKAVGAI